MEENLNNILMDMPGWYTFKMVMENILEKTIGIFKFCSALEK